ncbi:GTP-binding protein [Alicyclobacillus acidocaldarius]|uniref:Cobalamin synthesis protein P47K n=1 Tax=Alicyclobacillus acidocaldarius subsp. acidocaldarius (strain ATCC 27009 / DSM 446 / BCRC 14685 / JCM 5260 / KCTC 1825 / NBRC 15652 / NCIMB 11725 / NRRL B-14509 / 104-IA) TaxID=521098 RepID=C8WYA0_ALIAD|nr:GTP-binding protein [Alicyclobacillus acidocaldarius]ACV59994.1 cobalamin synthesis protein P47K [Alicyclobacillus acidocaldarius subsp. acidocaldarius DSM 446]
MSVKLVLLGGFLGAGKTTTLIRAAHMFQSAGQNVAVITNDQGTELIDTELSRLNELNTEEVTGGCFCCRFNELYDKLISLKSQFRPDVIIAEAVGSCTDLAATVIRPLKQYYGKEFDVAPLTVVVDPGRILSEIGPKEKINFSRSVSYIFDKQLSEADIIALNKIDKYEERCINDLEDYLQKRYPTAVIHTFSAHRGDNMERLLDLWRTLNISGEKALDIDYDKYAQGEAKLAWLNSLIDLSVDEANHFDAKLWMHMFLDKLHEHFLREKMAIAHLKVYVGSDNGFIKASIVETGDTPTYIVKEPVNGQEFRVVINIRIETEPELLSLVVADALAIVNKEMKVKWKQTYHECFSPLPPNPTHRLRVAAK